MQLGNQTNTPVALPPRMNNGIHSVGGWVEPTAGLDRFEKRKSLTSTGIRTEDHLKYRSPTHATKACVGIYLHLGLVLEENVCFAASSGHYLLGQESTIGWINLV
jgi:hypothetical protein